MKLDFLFSEAKKQVKEVGPSDLPKVEQNNSLVYISGVATNSEPIKDCFLGVQVENGVKLERKVEMYQWKPYIQGKDS